jgi:diaminohydroxyphosphoribosylaminopyrimidine deaminase/5-amino-6-(5-phosphoribosylamino)uracil reductase
VEGPVDRAVCEWVNRGFLSLKRRGRPWITLKRAVGADGGVANEDGSFRKITSDVQDAWSHTMLRARHDAILVGIGTVLADNPRLTVRHAAMQMLTSSKDSAAYQSLLPAAPPSPPPPYRIVLDRHAKTPTTANIIVHDPQRTLICVAESSDRGQETRVHALRRAGACVFILPTLDGFFDWSALWGALTTPVDGFDGLTSILVEGGPRTWTQFHGAGLVDAEVILRGS